MVKPLTPRPIAPPTAEIRGDSPAPADSAPVVRRPDIAAQEQRLRAGHEALGGSRPGPAADTTSGTSLADLKAQPTRSFPPIDVVLLTGGETGSIERVSRGVRATLKGLGIDNAKVAQPVLEKALHELLGLPEGGRFGSDRPAHAIDLNAFLAKLGVSLPPEKPVDDDALDGMQRFIRADPRLALAITHLASIDRHLPLDLFAEAKRARADDLTAETRAHSHDDTEPAPPKNYGLGKAERSRAARVAQEMVVMLTAFDIISLLHDGSWVAYSSLVSNAVNVRDDLMGRPEARPVQAALWQYGISSLLSFANGDDRKVHVQSLRAQLDEADQQGEPAREAALWAVTAGLVRDPTRARELGSIVGHPCAPAWLGELVAVENARIPSSSAKAATGASVWSAPLEAAMQPRSICDVPIGGVQDASGAFRTLYGPPAFGSWRFQDPNNAFALFGASRNMQIGLQRVTVLRPEKSVFLPGRGFAALPQALSDRLEAGELLVTSGENLFDLSEADVMQMARAPDLKGVTAVRDSKVAAAAEQNPTGYFLLTTCDDGNAGLGAGPRGGRTHLLMEMREGELQPVTAHIRGKEYGIELKGSGCVDGGFGLLGQRSGLPSLHGGAMAEQMARELIGLDSDTRDTAPVAGGIVLFDLARDGAQTHYGYGVRCCPTTLRATYTANPSLPQLDQTSGIETAHAYAQELANGLLSANPYLYRNSAHPENVMVGFNGPLQFCDHSDRHPLADVPNPVELIEQMLRTISEAGRAPEIRAAMYTRINDLFGERGIELGLDTRVIEDGAANEARVKASASQIWAKLPRAENIR